MTVVMESFELGCLKCHCNVISNALQLRFNLEVHVNLIADVYCFVLWLSLSFNCSYERLNIILSTSLKEAPCQKTELCINLFFVCLNHQVQLVGEN